LKLETETAMRFIINYGKKKAGMVNKITNRKGGESMLRHEALLCVIIELSFFRETMGLQPY
jgi:hypothetical protein